MRRFDPLHRRLLAVVGVLAAATVAGLIALWPSSEELPEGQQPADELVAGTVRSVETLDAVPDPELGLSGEQGRVTVEVGEGPDAGERVQLEVALDAHPPLASGDRVELSAVEGPDGGREYYISDFYRLPVLWALLGLFVVSVLLVGRWHGLRSLLGLGASLLVVAQFMVPAILAGGWPPLVALVGSLAVMMVTLYLTHGVNEMTTSAVIGTAVSLAVTVGLAMLFVSQGKVTGYSSEQAVFASFAVEGLDLQGLVLAGLIVAALGVLDDVTVSQSSTVFALHDTDPTLGFTGVFRRAMKVGRDHIASVVNTLFLAYAGASLALLLLFSTNELPVLEILNSELMAEEMIKILVGSLGLIGAVPVTTALAAWVAVRRRGAAEAA